jgi:hypothetical protein
MSRLKQNPRNKKSNASFSNIPQQLEQRQRGNP